MSYTQKELNNRIAVELDKHCIQNEYGYLLLDQDTAIRNKYKWCINISAAVWIDLAITLLSGFIGFITDLDWLVYIGIALFVVFLALFAIRYFHRKDISNLLPDTVKVKLSDILRKHSEYVDNLRFWFMEVGADKSTDKRTLNEIGTAFKMAFLDGNKCYNELSSLFGKMQQDLHDKAHQKAVEKLSQLIQFHIN